MIYDAAAGTDAVDGKWLWKQYLKYYGFVDYVVLHDFGISISPRFVTSDTLKLYKPMRHYTFSQGMHTQPHRHPVQGKN